MLPFQLMVLEKVNIYMQNMNLDSFSHPTQKLLKM